MIERARYDYFARIPFRVSFALRRRELSCPEFGVLCFLICEIEANKLAGGTGEVAYTKVELAEALGWTGKADTLYRHLAALGKARWIEFDPKAGLRRKKYVIRLGRAAIDAEAPSTSDGTSNSTSDPPAAPESEVTSNSTSDATSDYVPGWASSDPAPDRGSGLVGTSSGTPDGTSALACARGEKRREEQQEDSANAPSSCGDGRGIAPSPWVQDEEDVLPREEQLRRIRELQERLSGGAIPLEDDEDEKAEG
jgi:hypothetical protein